MELTLEAVKKKCQAILAEHPVVVLGSGASAAHGIPGMEGLKHHLVSSIDKEALQPVDKVIWGQFLLALETNDLETAFDVLAGSPLLQESVTKLSWELISKYDYDILVRVYSEGLILPLTRLYTYLLRSTHPTVGVVTTNYDCVAEYAADAGGYMHDTGFSLGIIRNKVTGNLKVVRGGRAERIVNICKVHGSLDWFVNSQEEVVGLPRGQQIPAGMLPHIITPGVSKYRFTHKEPYRSIIANADTELASAKAYICIGYGFNDEHIQAKLVTKCVKQEVPLLILARTLTQSAKDFITSGKCKAFIALEMYATGTRVYTNSYPAGVEFEGLDMWSLDGFLKEII